MYGASEGLRTLGVDIVGPGGQPDALEERELFGFATGNHGADLVQRGLVQAEKFGPHLSAPSAAVALGEDAGHVVVDLSDGTTVARRAVIVTTGARYRRLKADRLATSRTAGSYATTDLEARQCAGISKMIVEGGNSAGQAAVPSPTREAR